MQFSPGSHAKHLFHSAIRAIERVSFGYWGWVSMGKARKRKIGDILGEWEVKGHIATGGNGHVYKVAKREGEETICALKLLKNDSRTLRARFSDEIQALQNAAHIEGIVPLLDEERPIAKGQAQRWYVMPLAQTMAHFLGGRDAVEIVTAFVPLAETLAQLHELQIYHRDIKPANLLGLNGRLCFSDFGLVTFPDKDDLTPDRGTLGPKFTMAPEMRRNAKAAGGAAADVYSFAKALWIALTGETQGFDGQYSPITSVALGKFHSKLFTGPLDELLTRCTEHAPAMRPSIADVADALRDWLEVQKEFHLRNLAEWVTLQNSLFPAGMPSTAKWTGSQNISAILHEISRVNSLNHMFFPNGGGLDLIGVLPSNEAGCIELHVGTVRILKPSFLSFECFGPGSVWNFFWLEVEDLAPTGVEDAYIAADEMTEELCELRPKEYVGLEAWEQGEWEGEALPHSARRVTRILKGAFVIFAKRSWYNLKGSTYDARHYKMGYQQFRNHIAEAAARMPEPPPLRADS